MKEKTKSENEIVAIVDGMVVGTVGVEAVGRKYKVSHRTEFSIGIVKEFWGLGIGRALMNACMECDRNAGYVQIELNVAAENVRAVSMYERAGFVEYSRNPKGFPSRVAGFQEVIYMRFGIVRRVKNSPL